MGSGAEPWHLLGLMESSLRGGRNSGDLCGSSDQSWHMKRKRL